MLTISKAHEILSQKAEPLQIRRWAEGNAVEREFRGNSGYWAEFLYEDGSMVCYVGSTPTAYT